jgi:GNAT superfamily N-acetyltransferase
MREISAGQITDFRIRFVEENDISAVVTLIKELARYEKLEAQVETTEELLRESFFKHRAAEALIGELKGEAVGYAIFYQNFSSFTARPGLFVEDIYVKPNLRRMGLGRLFFVFMAKLAVDRGYARMEWTCLDWNEPSIAFYEKMGAQALSEWTMYRLAGKSLENVANEKKLETYFQA